MNSFKIIISEKADKEFSDALKYYENERKGLGAEFEKEINAIVSLLSEKPLLFPRKYKRYREAIVNKFPFFVVYEITISHVIVYSFFHTSRNPKKKYSKK